MNDLNNNEINEVPWAPYLIVTLETFSAFYLSTLAMAVYFTHGGLNWALASGLMVGLYVFVIGACIALLLKRLSSAALMLVIPIAPLLALGTVISLIPVLELFHR